MILVLDANILMRAVLGKGTRVLLARYHTTCDFIAPDQAFEEAARRLPGVIARRGLRMEPFMDYYRS